MPTTVNSPICMFEGVFAPGTVNDESRTIEVKWYTGARVERYSWSQQELYLLELSMDPKHVDLSRLKSGTAPLLNAHHSFDLEDIIGVIESAKIENGIGYATVRFSKRPEADVIFQDVKDGVIRNVSLGTSISALELIESKEGSPKVYRATKWQPYELSFVPVGADPQAQSFSKENREADPLEKLIKGGNEEMNENPQVTQTQQPAATPAAETVTQESLQLPTEQLAAERRAERERATAIIALCDKHGMTVEFRNEMLENGTELNDVRARILEKLSVKAPTVSSVHVTAEEKDKKKEAFTMALLNRAVPGKYKAEDNLASYRGRSLVEMSRKYLSDSGVNTENLSRREIAELALCGRTSMGAMMSTSDLPLILGNTIGRRLRDDYVELAPTWPQFCTRTNAVDFKEMTVVALSDLTEFKDIPEHGEYERGEVVDSAEKYAVQKSGIIIAFTWEMVVNDDLSALSRLPRRIASSAREKEAKTVYGILINNPKMSDGKAVFHADHGNLATSGGVPNETTLAAAVTAIFAQKDVNGTPINVKPRFLVHGGQTMVDVKKILSNDMSATKSSDVNVFKGEFVPVLDPHITDKKWFLISDPAFCDTIEYAYLDGEEGLFTEMRNGFEVDGLEIKARLVFGAKAIDWRGMYKNAGQ